MILGGMVKDNLFLVLWQIFFTRHLYPLSPTLKKILGNLILKPFLTVLTAGLGVTLFAKLTSRRREKKIISLIMR
jgi:hypothetical protein